MKKHIFKKDHFKVHIPITYTGLESEIWAGWARAPPLFFWRIRAGPHHFQNRDYSPAIAKYFIILRKIKIDRYSSGVLVWSMLTVLVSMTLEFGVVIWKVLQEMTKQFHQVLIYDLLNNPN